MRPLTKKIGWASGAAFLLVALLSSVIAETDDVPQELLYEDRGDVSSEMELPVTAVRMRGGSARPVNLEEDTTRATTRSASYSSEEEEEEEDDTPSMDDMDSEEESSSSSTSSSSSSSSSDSSHEDHHNQHQHLRGHNDVSPLVPSWTREAHRARHLSTYKCGGSCASDGDCGYGDQNCNRCFKEGTFMGKCINTRCIDGTYMACGLDIDCENSGCPQSICVAGECREDGNRNSLGGCVGTNENCLNNACCKSTDACTQTSLDSPLTCQPGSTVTGGGGVINPGNRFGNRFVGGGGVGVIDYSYCSYLSCTYNGDPICLNQGCGTQCVYGQCIPPVVAPVIGGNRGNGLVGSGCNSNFECGLIAYCEFDPYNQGSGVVTGFRGICQPFNGVQTCPLIRCQGDERCFSVARSAGIQIGACRGGCIGGRCSS